MLVGYPNHHEGDVYWMLNLETGRITEMRVITWMFRMNCKNANSETTKKLPVVSLQIPWTADSDSDDDDKIVNEAVPTLNSEVRKDDDLECTHSESSSSQASNIDRWVKQTTRSGRQIGLKSGIYDPVNGKAAV